MKSDKKCIEKIQKHLDEFIAENNSQVNFTITNNKVILTCRGDASESRMRVFLEKALGIKAMNKFGDIFIAHPMIFNREMNLFLDEQSKNGSKYHEARLLFNSQTERAIVQTS